MEGVCRAPGNLRWIEVRVSHYVELNVNNGTVHLYSTVQCSRLGNVGGLNLFDVEYTFS